MLIHFITIELLIDHTTLIGYSFEIKTYYVTSGPCAIDPISVTKGPLSLPPPKKSVIYYLYDPRKYGCLVVIVEESMLRCYLTSRTLLSIIHLMIRAEIKELKT